MKNTVVSFQEAKGQEKLTMLTAYDYTTARLVDQAVNAILVGDSLGMVMLGYADTLSVTVDDMLHHCKAVTRGASEALVVCDLPFMSYQISVDDCLRNASRLMKEGGAAAVKLEGGADFCPQVRALTRASIPVMGHLGLTPQSVRALGGYKVQGKSTAAAQQLLDDARALQDAGAFSLVLECVPAALAAHISREIAIPTIGIGAGPDCDGQVLVWQDMLGLSDDEAPKFVRRFGTAAEAVRSAIAAYTSAVKNSSFPAHEHCYAMDEAMLKSLR